MAESSLNYRRVPLEEGLVVELTSTTCLVIRPTALGHSIELLAPTVGLQRLRTQDSIPNCAPGRPPGPAVRVLRARLAKETGLTRTDLVNWYAATFQVSRNVARQAVRREWIRVGGR